MHIEDGIWNCHDICVEIVGEEPIAFGVFHTIPSVIDLPSAGKVGVTGRHHGTGVKGRGNDTRMHLSGVNEKAVMVLK